MKDKRVVERVIPKQQPKGKLILSACELSFDVIEVRDVSPFGIGACIDGEISKDTGIQLRYKNGDDELLIYGVIAWSAMSVASEKQVHLSRVGICLRPENIEANLKFYRLMIN